MTKLMLYIPKKIRNILEKAGKQSISLNSEKDTTKRNLKKKKKL